MRRLRLKAEGFTLIELLVVIAIIGILAAIAIPQFAAYRRRGYDSDVKSNLKNMATSQEAYFVDQNTYSSALSGLTARGYKQSDNVIVAVQTASATHFVVTGTTKAGCGSEGGWSFDSTSGKLTGSACS